MTYVFICVYVYIICIQTIKIVVFTFYNSIGFWGKNVELYIFIDNNYMHVYCNVFKYNWVYKYIFKWMGKVLKN